MKDFKTLSSKVMLAALVMLVGLGLVTGASWAQKAASGDTGGVSTPKSVTVPPTKGVVQVQVPNLIGKTEEVAKKELSKVGLKPGKVQFTTVEKGTPGTVVKQHPTAKTKVAEGSAVDLWILKGAAKVTPKIVQKGEKVFMEFPEVVKNIVISDAKGNELQHFKKGKRFEITESVVKTKAGRIKIAFTPLGGTIKKRGGPEPPQQEDIDLAQLRIAPVAKALLPKAAQKLDFDDTTIENGESSNNNFTGATLLTHNKMYSGTVGGSEDPCDYLRMAAGSGGIGSLIEVGVWSGSGNAQLTLYGPQQNLVAGPADRVWIALEPNITVYLKVTPLGPDSTHYIISAHATELIDDNEPNNDNVLFAHYIGTPPASASSRFMDACNGVLLKSFHDGDYFKIKLPYKKIQISVTDAFPSPAITLFDPRREGDLSPSFAVSASQSNYSSTGAGYVFDMPAIYPEDGWGWNPDWWNNKYWFIQVHTRGGGLSTYGTGEPPECYTTTTKYQLTVIEIP